MHDFILHHRLKSLIRHASYAVNPNFLYLGGSSGSSRCEMDEADGTLDRPGGLGTKRAIKLILERSLLERSRREAAVASIVQVSLHCSCDQASEAVTWCVWRCYLLQKELPLHPSEPSRHAG
jgi:hypothetical protein